MSLLDSAKEKEKTGGWWLVKEDWRGSPSEVGESQEMDLETGRLLKAHRYLAFTWHLKTVTAHESTLRQSKG